MGIFDEQPWGLSASGVIAAAMEPGRMGGGDVKLAAVIVALLGPVSPWLSLAAIAGALVLTLVGMTMRTARHAPLAPRSRRPP